MNPDLQIKIAGLSLKNPVITASGTFGYGSEFEDFMDLSQLGGIVVKGITLNPREGNPYPRMAETASGMINAVGLQNCGVKHFADVIYPNIKNYGTQIIVNVNGSVVEDYIAVTEQIAQLDGIEAIELNISCPNVKEGGMAFGTSCEASARVTKAVRKAWPKTLIVKLSPNVTDIASIAKTVEAEGADAVSLTNTFLAMAVDIHSRKPLVSTVTGGLSGPCIKPISLRMVWQVYNAVKIPVIGMGGIMNAADAVEFIIAGASAVQIGTANFIDPAIAQKVVLGIEDYMKQYDFKDINSLRGSLQV